MYSTVYSTIIYNIYVSLMEKIQVMMIMMTTLSTGSTGYRPETAGLLSHK
jgi:hypothetical protein